MLNITPLHKNKTSLPAIDTIIYQSRPSDIRGWITHTSVLQNSIREGIKFSRTHAQISENYIKTSLPNYRNLYTQLVSQKGFKLCQNI